jgi:hypothetical protein
MIKKEKNMKYIIGKLTLSGLLAAALVVLTGCQSDGGDTGPRKVSVEMQAYASTYGDAVQKASTRAWPPSSDFEIYSGKDAIRVVFTKGNQIAEFTGGTADGSFVYSAVDSKWFSTFEVKNLNNNPYYLYGYMPAVGNLSLAPVSGDYVNGASMTITSLPTATTSDICVIIGVKKGSSSTNDVIGEDGGIKMGQFSYDLSGETNHVFLLCDHLYAALHMSFRVNETYNALRRIKLKKVWVKDCIKDEDAPFTSKTNVVINLHSNATGVSPIQSITFTNDGTNSVTDMEQSPLYNNTEGLLLTTSYQNVQGCMAPIGMTEFTLVSQYDVYDTNGNLIRQNQTAANKIKISDLFTATTSLLRGTRYTLYLTVNPTYLYMLSEPDLDNPTVEVGS